MKYQSEPSKKTHNNLCFLIKFRLLISNDYLIKISNWDMNLFSFTFYHQNNFALITRKYFYSLCAVLLSTLLLYNFFL